MKNITNGFGGKKAHGYDKMPMKLLQKCNYSPQLIAVYNYPSLPYIPASGAEVFTTSLPFPLIQTMGLYGDT